MNEEKNDSAFQRYQFDKYLSTKQKDTDIPTPPREEMSKKAQMKKYAEKIRGILED